jgi:hypothetical protein
LQEGKLIVEGPESIAELAAIWGPLTQMNGARSLVAVHTQPRCRFIEQNQLILDRLGVRVTKVARHLLMRTFQRVIRLFLVVEIRGLPAIHAMTSLTVCSLRIFDELTGVDIFMAGRTNRGCVFENDLGGLARGT